MASPTRSERIVRVAFGRYLGLCTAVAAGRKWTAGDRTRACCCRARRDIGERRWIDLAFNGKTSVILLGPSSIRAVPSPFITDHAPHHSQKSYSCKQKHRLKMPVHTCDAWRTHLAHCRTHRPNTHTHTIIITSSHITHHTKFYQAADSTSSLDCRGERRGEPRGDVVDWPIAL